MLIKSYSLMLLYTYKNNPKQKYQIDIWCWPLPKFICQDQYIKSRNDASRLKRIMSYFNLNAAEGFSPLQKINV